MDLAWRIALAAIGLLWARSALYATIWGHGALAKRAVGVALGLALAAPLARYDEAALRWLAAAALVLLLPYRRLFLAHFDRVTRRGARRLAAEWGATFREDRERGLFELVRPASDATVLLTSERGTSSHHLAAAEPERSIANVLAHVRSLHPGVRARETYRMLAFVVRLGAPSPLRCSLMKGWSEPRYFEKEWRETTSMQGEHFALSMGALLEDGAHPTGGTAADLAPHPGPRDERFGAFHVLVSAPGPFEEVFRGELLDDFFRSASATLPYELNVTPTSVNIYTTYCSYAAQKRNVDLLLKLAARLERTEDKILKFIRATGARDAARIVEYDRWSKSPEGIARLAALLHDAAAPIDLRIGAARLLRDAPDPAATDALVRAASDADREIRAWCTCCLFQRGGDPQAVAFAANLLHDPEREVRIGAARALGHMEPGSEALREMARALEEVRARIRSAKPDDAGRQEALEEVRALAGALSSHREKPAFAESVAPAFGPVLVEILRDSEAAATSSAAAMLGEFGDRRNLAPLVEVLDAPEGTSDKADLLSAASALARLRGPEAVAALERELERPRARAWGESGYAWEIWAALAEAKSGSKICKCFGCREEAVADWTIFCPFCDDSPHHIHCLGCGKVSREHPSTGARFFTCEECRARKPR